MLLDPQAQAMLDRAIQNGAAALIELNPQEAREAYRKSRLPTQPKPPPVVVCRDFEVPGPDVPVPVREYRPRSSQPNAVLSALVYFHGGGWVIGDRDTHDVLCRELCNFSGCAVFSVDYRLAPEHPFPAAVHDALAATRWVASHAQELVIDASRIAIGGDSAGGNLAAVVALSLRGDAGVRLAYQLLIYPVTDLRCQTSSYRQYAQGYTLTARDMAYFGRHYAPDSATAADWRVSPLLAADHSGLPPALIITAGFDPLRDEGRLYADKLSSSSVATQYICFERQMHGFIGMGGVIDEANTAVRLCADLLKRQL